MRVREKEREKEIMRARDGERDRGICALGSYPENQKERESEGKRERERGKER